MFMDSEASKLSGKGSEDLQEFSQDEFEQFLFEENDTNPMHFQSGGPTPQSQQFPIKDELDLNMDFKMDKHEFANSGSSGSTETTSSPPEEHIRGGNVKSFLGKPMEQPSPPSWSTPQGHKVREVWMQIANLSLSIYKLTQTCNFEHFDRSIYGYLQRLAFELVKTIYTLPSVSRERIAAQQASPVLPSSSPSPSLQQPQQSVHQPSPSPSKAEETSSSKPIAITPHQLNQPSFYQQYFHQSHPPSSQPPSLSASRPSTTPITTTRPITQTKFFTSGKVKRQRRNSNQVYSCQQCGVTKTPEWRRGPSGECNLCNRCGLQYAKSKKQQQQKQMSQQRSQTSPFRFQAPGNT